jgi:hypothetical protein
MAAPSLPEIRTSSGRLLLPATRLIVQWPEQTETKQRLVAKGLLDPPAPRWVTPRTGQVYTPDQWQDEQVHWHCHRSSGDPEKTPKHLRTWIVKDPKVELVARTPAEALIWLWERWEADLPRVPKHYRQQGDYDRLLSDEGRWWHSEHRWVRLCLGRSIYDAHMLNPRTQLRYHVDAARPADCQDH